MEKDSNNLQEPLLQSEVAMDWRTALLQEERERVTNEMMETLTRNIPLVRPKDVQILKNIAARHEEVIYNEATSQWDYTRRVSLKMKKMNAYSTNRMANSPQSNAASNHENAQDPVSESQAQDQVEQLPTAMVSDQSQVPDSIASTGVQNSAGLAPAGPSVDGKSQNTIPGVPVQNLNAQNMPNETLSAVRDPMMQGRSTNSMFQCGQQQQQVMLQSAAQSHIQIQKLLRHEQLLLQQLQHQQRVYNQFQVQSQNIPDSIASTGVLNYAGSAPAGPSVDGKSQGTMPGVPVQNLNVQNMFNETLSAVRDPMMQGRSTNSMFQSGQQQQVMPQSVAQSHIQKQKLLQHERLLLQQLQHQQRVSNQYQVQSQNIPDSIALTGVQNSSGSALAGPSVDGKSQGTIPGVPVQNLNAQNMSNETLSAVRDPMMQGWSTNSMFQSGQQQQVMPLSVAHERQLLQQLQHQQRVYNQSQWQKQKMYVLQQHMAMQQSQLGLKQEANTLPVETQQRVQSASPVLQPQTTIDQKKQLSQSQGNMPGFKLTSQSQIQDHVQQLPTAMASNQSQVQPQNIQDNIASTEVPNSAASSPAMPPLVDGKSQGTIPRVPVQNLNAQNMSNETPFAARHPMMQGCPTNSTFQFGQQQVAPQFTTQSHIQQQQKMNLLQPNQQTTIDQTKQLSQSQGIKLVSGIHSDTGKKAVTAIKKRHRNPVSQQQQPQIPPNEDQMNSQMQQINMQSPVMPTQPNNSTGVQQNIFSSGSDVSNSRQGNVLNQTQEASSQNELSGKSNSSVNQPQDNDDALNETQEVAEDPLQQNPVGGCVSSQNGPTALQADSKAVPLQQIEMLSAQLLHQHQQQLQMLEQYMVKLSTQQEQMQQQLFRQQQQQMQQQLLRQMLEQYMVKLSTQQEQMQQQLFRQQQQQQMQQQLLRPQLVHYQQWQQQTSQKQSEQQSILQQQLKQQQEQTSRKQSAEQQPIQQQQERTSQKQSGQQMTPETAHTAFSVLAVLVVMMMLLIAWKL